jgi:hypothetical protein
MATLSEGRRPGEFIMSEATGHRSREAVKITASQTIEPNQVLAKKAVAADVALSQAFAGTGNGVLTPASPAVSSKVKDGVYSVVCVTAAANAGTFRVEDPAGVHVGNAVVGVAFDGEVKFTIADGATDFVVGDKFSLTVKRDAVDVVWGAYDQDATDGFEIPAGIAIYGVTTGVGESANVTAIVRDAEVNGNCVVWPSDIDAAEKTDGEQALAELGVIVRY